MIVLTGKVEKRAIKISDIFTIVEILNKCYSKTSFLVVRGMADRFDFELPVMTFE
jgi:hypothetical protein